MYWAYNTLVEKASCEKSTLFLCYVDFRKAFDSVDCYRLWKKLVQLGINQQTLQSMYSKAMSRVKLSNHEVTDQFRGSEARLQPEPSSF